MKRDRPADNELSDEMSNVEIRPQLLHAAGYTSWVFRPSDWSDWLVVRLTPSGEEVWSVIRDGEQQYSGDMAYCITMGSDGNIYVGGESVEQDGAFAVVQFGETGGEGWVYSTGPSGEAWSIVAGSGALYVAGYTRDTFDDFTVVSLSNSGTERWVYKHPATVNHSYAYSVALDAVEEFVYAAGGVITGDDHDFCVVKLDASSGEEQWRYQYDGPGQRSDEAHSIIVGADGNIYAAGYSQVGGTGYDLTVISLTPDKTERWVYQYDGGAGLADSATSLVMGMDGNLYIAGKSTQLGHEWPDFTVIGLTADIPPEELWVYAYDGTEFDYGDIARSVVIGPDMNVYAAGCTWETGTYKDFTVVSLGIVTDPLATAYPQGAKLCRVPGTSHLWFTYSSQGAVYAGHTADGGETRRIWYLGAGEFSTIDIVPPYSIPTGGSGQPYPGLFHPLVVWEAPESGPELYCARYYDQEWQVAELFSDPSGRTPRLPSLVIDLHGKAHLAWEAIDQADMQYLNYGTFPARQWPPPFTHNQSNLGYDGGSGWHMAPCIGFDHLPEWERPHIVYKKTTPTNGIYYRTKNQSGGWELAQFISQGWWTSSFPFLEIYGGNMKALWHGYEPPGSEIDEVWYRWKQVQWDFWWPEFWPVSDTPTESYFPSMSVAYASWSEEFAPEWEILMRNEPFQGSYQNISNSPNALSMYSHVNCWHRRPFNPSYLYFLWTEGTDPSYEVKILQYELPYECLAFYHVETGQEEPSYYCVQRDSFIQFGPEPYKQVDIHQSQIIYRFRGLKPWMYYPLTVTGYWDGAGPIQQWVYIDGINKGPLNLTPGEPETLAVSIPTDAYKDDNEVYVAVLKTGGQWAVTGPLTVHEFEEEEGIGGGFQSARASGLEPRGFLLSQNYPNPVRDETAIGYYLPSDGSLSLKIYDICGRLIRTLVDGPEQAGYQEVSWNGRDDAGRRVPSGIYFYRLDAGEFRSTHKMTILR